MNSYGAKPANSTHEFNSKTTEASRFNALLRAYFRLSPLPHSGAAILGQKSNFSKLHHSQPITYNEEVGTLVPKSEFKPHLCCERFRTPVNTHEHLIQAGTLRNSTILPVIPPLPSSSCASLACTSGNRCAISGLSLCC